MVQAGTESRSPIVVAFNGWIIGVVPHTGESAWSYEIPGRDIRIAFAGDRVFAISAMTLVCLDYRTGTEQWTARWKAPASAINATLLVHDDRVFVGGGGTVTCYAASDGKQLWREEFKGKGSGSVSLGVPGNVAQVDLEG